MHPGLNKYMMQLRMESKEKENQGKPPITSPDVVQTADFVFSRIPHQEGDSGRLLLAKQKVSRETRLYRLCLQRVHLYQIGSGDGILYAGRGLIPALSRGKAALFQNGVYYRGTILDRDRSSAYL